MTDEPKRVPFSQALPGRAAALASLETGPLFAKRRSCSSPARTSQLLFISQRIGLVRSPGSDAERVLSPYLSTGPH